VLALILTAALLSSLSVYQEITKTYTYEFSGLAQRALPEDIGRTTVRYSDRSAGPIGDANRFAQILLVLLPLAFVAAATEKSRAIQIGAASAGVLILGGVLTTQSRGAMIAMPVMLIVMVLTRLIRLRTALATTVGAVALLILLSPANLDRIASIGTVTGVIDRNSVIETESVIRKRLTEMGSAFHTFADHPLLGVGPGHYAPFYSIRYQSDPDVAFTHIDEERRAHTLYFEMAAETGIIGLAIFLGIVVSLMSQLRSYGQRMSVQYPQLTSAAMGFFVAITGYLVAAVFLHLSFERYYWLLLALAGALVQVMRQIEEDREEHCYASSRTTE
jgi:O-antigen ligase